MDEKEQAIDKILKDVSNLRWRMIDLTNEIQGLRRVIRINSQLLKRYLQMMCDEEND